MDMIFWYGILIIIQKECIPSMQSLVILFNFNSKSRLGGAKVKQCSEILFDHMYPCH